MTSDGFANTESPPDLPVVQPEPAAPPAPIVISIVEPTSTELRCITSPAPPPPAQYPLPPPPPPPATISTSASEVTPEGTAQVQPAVTVVNSTYVIPAEVEVRSGVHAAKALAGCSIAPPTISTDTSATTPAVAK